MQISPKSAKLLDGIIQDVEVRRQVCLGLDVRPGSECFGKNSHLNPGFSITN